jgi:hypothetical protein
VTGLTPAQAKRQGWLLKVEFEAPSILPAEEWAALAGAMSAAEREAFIMRGRRFRPAIHAQLDELSDEIAARKGLRKARRHAQSRSAAAT